MNISVCLPPNFPTRSNNHELSALGLDVKAAHKRVVIKESHRGLLGFSHRSALYFYKVAPFGAIFSARWWGRLGSFWVHFLHRAIFVAHALFLFADDSLCIFLERLSLLSASCFAELDSTHISGPSNEFAEALSRFIAGSQ